MALNMPRVYEEEAAYLRAELDRALETIRLNPPRKKALLVLGQEGMGVEAELAPVDYATQVKGK